MRLCGEVRGGRLDDCLDGKGAHREPVAKNTEFLILMMPFTSEMILNIL